MTVLVPITWGEVTARLAIALLVGAVIGLERESRGKAAGLRTHLLVSLGVALLVLLSMQTSADPQNLGAVSRIMQGIIVGVGFLEAGVIVSHRSRSHSREATVKGETSAAELWVTVALALAASCGLWCLTLIGTGFVLLILRIFKHIEGS